MKPKADRAVKTGLFLGVIVSLAMAAGWRLARAAGPAELELEPGASVQLARGEMDLVSKRVKEESFDGSPVHESRSATAMAVNEALRALRVRKWARDWPGNVTSAVAVRLDGPGGVMEVLVLPGGFAVIREGDRVRACQGTRVYELFTELVRAAETR